jgi:hypothetical protein
MNEETVIRNLTGDLASLKERVDEFYNLARELYSKGDDKRGNLYLEAANNISNRVNDLERERLKLQWTEKPPLFEKKRVCEELSITDALNTLKNLEYVVVSAPGDRFVVMYPNGAVLNNSREDGTVPPGRVIAHAEWILDGKQGNVLEEG